MISFGDNNNMGIIWGSSGNNRAIQEAVQRIQIIVTEVFQVHISKLPLIPTFTV